MLKEHVVEEVLARLTRGAAVLGLAYEYDITPRQCARGGRGGGINHASRASGGQFSIRTRSG